MNSILKFLGFDHAAERTRRLRKRRKEFEDDEDFEEEAEPRVAEKEIHSPREKARLIYFRGLASDDDKLHLRDALLEGCVVIIDLTGITLDQKETGLQFITFMSGVAFANKGEFIKLGPTLFSVSPRSGMVQSVVGDAVPHGVRHDG